MPEVTPAKGTLIGIFAFRREGCKTPQLKAFFQLDTANAGTLIYTVEDGSQILCGSGHDLKSAMEDACLKESDRRES